MFKRFNKRILSWGLFFVIVIGFVATMFILSPKNSLVRYGQSEIVGFSDLAGQDITDIVMASTTPIDIAENQNYLMSVCNDGNLCIKDKNTGNVWKGVPDNYTEAVEHSALRLKFYLDESNSVEMNSDEHCVQLGQYKIYKNELGFSVQYVFGEMKKEFVFPMQISEKRFKQFIGKMSSEDKEFIERQYEFYDIEDARKMQGDNYAELLLSKYPRLKKENIYAIVDEKSDRIKTRINDAFISVGYSSEDKANDEDGGTGEKQEKNPCLQLTVNYLLENDGFVASIDAEDIKFYSEYPLTDIELLPEFDCETDDGYLFIPSGNGALIETGKESKSDEFKLKIYGDNVALKQSLYSVDKMATLPVFGQVNKNKSFFAIIEDGDTQVNVCTKRRPGKASVYADFSLVDSGSFKMAARNESVLFAKDAYKGTFQVKYLLNSNAQKRSEYSNWASYYKEYLKNNDLLPSTNKINENPTFLIETMGSIAKEYSFLGMVPAVKNEIITSIEETNDILKDISKYCPTESIRLLYSGFSDMGLNKQSPFKYNRNSKIVSKSEFNDFKEKLNAKGISLYLDIEVPLTQATKGFTSSKHSARAINQNIIKLSTTDSLNNIVSEFQLVSPKQYEKILKNYSENKELLNSGIGISQLGYMLYGDYNEKTPVYTWQIPKTLNSELKNFKNILADGGNMYMIKNLDHINNFPVFSSQSNVFDKEIPFLSIVLHGFIDYSGFNMNDSSNHRGTILKMIESGCGLHYIVNDGCNDIVFDTDFEYLYNTEYKNIDGQIKKDYEMIFDALHDLGKIQIIKHEFITDDVVKVEYENGVSIYINYGKNDYTIADNTVKSNSYLRVGA